MLDRNHDPTPGAAGNRPPFTAWGGYFRLRQISCPIFILYENPVPIRDHMPGLEKELVTVIGRAIVRNPKDRFPDAGKLLASISLK
jgi:hypothetical protein